MRYIINYLSFNESKGISNSCEKILFEIWKNIQNDIENMISNSYYINIQETDFKIKNLKIDYNLIIGDQNLCNAISNLSKSYIENKYLNEVYISMNIEVSDMCDEFLYYIESVLFHELLHIFQHYNIKMNNKFRPESFSIGSIIPQLRQIIKTKYAKYILDILYFSLSHELSAQLHQYFFFKKKNEDYKKLKEIKSFLNSFEIRQLDDKEYEEIKLIKNHILNSIKYYSNNKKYKNDILKSLWNEEDVDLFLKKLSSIIEYKVKWIDKKIKLIDKIPILNESNIRYDITISLPNNWDNHEDVEKIEIYNFINKNLNDCKIVNGI